MGARSVAAWSMDGPLYIAVAQQRDNAGELYLGSPVFIYNQRNYNAQLELFPLKKVLQIALHS